MLLKSDLLAQIKAGRIDTVFRRWRRATVKAGGTLTTQAGVLGIDSIEPIALSDVTLADVRRAGFADVPAFHAWLDTMKQGELCIIRLRYLGDDPRIALRNAGTLTDADASEIAAALAKLDARSPWTAQALQLIARHPARLAEDLAGLAGQQRAPFKARIRRLKALGLTESLEIGYRLSPRGEAYLRRAKASG